MTLDLRGMPGNQRVVVVDTRAEYDEKNMGSLVAGIHKIRLDKTSDWVVAVGSFDTSKQRHGVNNTGDTEVMDNTDE